MPSKSKKAHFHIERHSPKEWRIVNAHLGHGLIFPTRELARISVRKLNSDMKRWLERGINTLPHR
jgi:hypothetical protein